METVYGFSKTDRSARVQWLLEELGRPYQFQKLSYRDGDHEKPEYLAMNPMGMSPSYRSGATTMFESGAICSYLADQDPSKRLAPSSDSPERADYLKWMFFTAVTLDSKFNEWVYAEMAEDAKWIAEVKTELNEISAIYESHLAKSDYLLASGFSAADILAVNVLNWYDDGMLEARPAIRRYIALLKARPAARAAQAFKD